MATTKISRSRDEIHVAGGALTYALQHNVEHRGAASAALVAKYAAKLGDGALGVLVQMQAESYGLFCDQLAAGFKAWADGEAPVPDDVEVDDGGAIMCPSCDGEMNLDPMDEAPFEHVCPSCGWRERR